MASLKLFHISIIFLAAATSLAIPNLLLMPEGQAKPAAFKVVVKVYNYASGCEDDEPCDTYEYKIWLTTGTGANKTKTVFSDDEPTVVTIAFQPGAIREGEKFGACAEVQTDGEQFKNCATGVYWTGKEMEVIQINLGI